MLTTTDQLVHSLMCVRACVHVRKAIVSLLLRTVTIQRYVHTHTYIFQKDSQEGPRSFIFVSRGALQNQDKLMVLIHDNGVVRAGQWSRR